MRYLSLFINGELQAQIETDLSDEQAMDIDDMLRENGVLGEEDELAITEDIPGVIGRSTAKLF